MAESSARLALRELRGHFGCQSRDVMKSLEGALTMVQSKPISYFCAYLHPGCSFCPVCPPSIAVTCGSFRKMALVPQDCIYLSYRPFGMFILQSLSMVQNI